MSSYNNIRKIKYTKNPSDVVTLQEYIVFEDQRQRQKYVVFKFINNLNQRLNGLKFEVLQYDNGGALLEKSIALYDNFTVECNSSFVPNAKLKVNYNCESIVVNLVFASFDRVKWEGGQFTDNSYKFENYASTVPQINTAYTEPVKNVSAPPKSKTKTKKEKFKINNNFGTKNIIRKNIAVFPKVFGVFVCLAVIAFVAVTLVLFTHTSNKINIDGFDLYVVSDTRADICGYDGIEENLTIPEVIGDYKIGKIRQGSFVNSRINKLSFINEDVLVIENGAFVNCKNLTSVSGNGEGEITLMSGAFQDCANLNSVILPEAILSPLSLSGCGVKQLSFKGLSGCTAISELFGEQDNVSLVTLTTSLSTLSANFLDGVKVANLELLNENCIAEYGALKDGGVNGYTFNDYCEALNGEVLSVNVIDGCFTLPAGISKFSTDKFSSYLSGVKSLKLETTKSDVKIDWQFFTAFKNITSLEITDDLFEPGTLSDLSSLKVFTSPVLSVSLCYYLNGTAVTSIGVTGTGSVNSEYFTSLTNVTSVNIAETVSSVDSTAFIYMKLKELSIPYYSKLPRLSNEYAGITNLEKLELKPYLYNGIVLNKSISGSYFKGLGNLKELNIAEGFTQCGSEIVGAQSLLTAISFPTSIVNYSYPVIGSGCTALKDVSVSFSGNEPSAYSVFNASSSYTENLEIGFKKLLNTFFTASCGSITSLTLKCDALGKENAQILQAFNYLKVLKIEANELSINLIDLFKVSPVSALVIDRVDVYCPEILEGFFTVNAYVKLGDCYFNGEKK